MEFTRPLGKKWVGELDLISIHVSTPENKNPYAKWDQIAARYWIHHNLNKRWKVSYFVTFYNSFQIKENDQVKSQEWRTGPQGIYYIHRRGEDKLTTRGRFEVRFIENSGQMYNVSYRYRQMVKYLKPISKPAKNENRWYSFVMDEIFLNVFNDPEETVDRNRFTIGFGHSFSKDFQIEVSYRNEFLPRKEHYKMYNQLFTSVTINNLYAKLTNRTPHSELDVKSDE